MRKLLLPLLLGACLMAHAQSMLPVKQNGKWGFINMEGKIIIEPAYDEAAIFKDGYAVVGIKGRKGIIDSSGTLVIPAEYDGAEPLASGFFALRKGKWSLASLKGKVYGNFNYDIVRSLDYKSIQLIDSGRSYLFHIPTQQLSDQSWDRIEIIEKGKWYSVWKQGKIGVVDSMHQVFVQPLLAQEILYDQHVFVIKNGARYSFIGPGGEPVITEKSWLYYKVLHPKMLVVYDKPSELSLLNLRDHKLILQHDYHQYRVLNEDFIVCVKLHLEGLANWNGDILIPNEYQSISWYGGDGMIRIKKDDKTGVANTNGKIIIPAEYSFIDPFDKFNRAVAGKGTKMGILAKNGSTIIPFVYDNLIMEEDVIKAYSGESLDVYTLNAKGLPEEKIHYNQVQTIQLNNRYRPQQVNYFDNRDFDYNLVSRAAAGNVSEGDIDYNGRFERLEKGVAYTAQSRIKCVISNNQESVWSLCGVWDTIRKKRIAEAEYWDIRVGELNRQNWGRIILPGGRQGLISRTGAIKTQFTVKKGTRTAPANIAYIGPFRYGLARVNVGGKLNGSANMGNWETWRDNRPSLAWYTLSVSNGVWGFVNGEGEMQIPAEYSYLSTFANGKSIAAKEGKFGVIDTLNHFVIPLKYDLITYLPKCNDQYFKLAHSKTRYGLVDAKGHVVLKAEYQNVGYASEGLVPVKQNDHWGFVDMNGTMVIQPEYEMVSSFSEGLAMVKKKALYGFIDRSGRIVIDCKYGSAIDMHDGKVAVKLQGKWGYLDKDGKILIPFTLGKVSRFNNGIAMASVKGKWGLLDASGKWIVRPAYDKITLSETDSYYRLFKNGHCYLASPQGKVLHHVNYESVGEFHEGMAVVKEKSHYGYIDTTGKLVIPIHFVSAKNFSEGLAAACDKYRTGYINKTGKFEIDPKYRIAGEFHEGIALVIENNFIVAIDRHGSLLWTTTESVMHGNFSEGYAWIGKSYFNQNGQPLINNVNKGSEFKNGVALVNNAIVNPAGEHLADFDYIASYKNGYAPYSINATYGIADLNGKIILEPEYQKIQLIMPGVFLIENFESIGYITADGRWIWQPSR